MLMSRLGVPHLSTGELLRRTKGKSPLGDLVSSYIDRGCLAPDFLVMPLVMRLLTQKDFEAGCLFDGFPRTVNQAEFLQDHLKKLNQRIAMVVHLKVGEDVLIDRLSDRSRREGRADDHQDGVSQRLRIYRERTQPVLDFYARSGLVRQLDGSGSPQEVHRKIISQVEGIGAI